MQTITALGDIGSYSTPCVGTINGSTYLISGSGINGWFGLRNTGNSTQWTSNASIISGLSTTLDFFIPHFYTRGSDTYLAVGDGLGTITGYRWNGSGWDADSASEAGLIDVGVNASVTTTNDNGSLYMIAGNSTGEFTTFRWNG